MFLRAVSEVFVGHSIEFEGENWVVVAKELVPSMRAAVEFKLTIRTLGDPSNPLELTGLTPDDLVNVVPDKNFVQAAPTHT